MAGGRRENAGRKKAEKPRDIVKQIRWTAEEWAAIEKARRAGGITFSASDFIRRTVLSAIT